MANKVVGLRHSTGEYNGRTYDNMLVHCTYESKEMEGLGAIVLKVKTDAFLNAPCKIGDMVEAVYNRFGNVVGIVKA